MTKIVLGAPFCFWALIVGLNVPKYIHETLILGKSIKEYSQNADLSSPVYIYYFPKGQS
jgi:hypothetical protein